MAWLKRFPGVIFYYRYQTIISIFCISILFYVANQSGFVCSNHEIETTIQELCQKYESGLVVGKLCEPLCKNSKFSSVSCTSSHNGKELVFSAQWENLNVHVKSAYPPGNRLTSDIPLKISEDDFKLAILDLIGQKLNTSVTQDQLNRLIRLESKNTKNREYERQNIYTLLQSQEYLLSVLFNDRDIFPQIYATCGHLYAVETVSQPNFNSYYTWSNIWSKRLKFAILIMDLLEQLETDFNDPIRLCDVKIQHFGLTNLGKLKYLDLDHVYPENSLQSITGGGQSCQTDADCDLFDCKALCNTETKRCDTGTTNNNLQVICEKIFLGWTLSGKLMVPGLLMTIKTPPSLASLLRQCAENGRSPVPEDIRQRLYTTLTEMDQILTDRIEET